MKLKGAAKKMNPKTPVLLAVVLGAALMAAPLMAYADVTYDDDIAEAFGSNTAVVDEDRLPEAKVQKSPRHAEVLCNLVDP